MFPNLSITLYILRRIAPHVCTLILYLTVFVHEFRVYTHLNVHVMYIHCDVIIALCMYTMYGFMTSSNHICIHVHVASSVSVIFLEYQRASYVMVVGRIYEAMISVLATLWETLPWKQFQGSVSDLGVSSNKANTYCTVLVLWYAIYCCTLFA